MKKRNQAELAVECPPRVKVMVEPMVREGGYRAISRHEGELVLRFGWCRATVWRTARWIVFGVLFYGAVVALGVSIEGWQSAIVPAVIGTFSLLFGAYIAIAQALNSTTITIDDEVLYWEHGPLSYEPGGVVSIFQITGMRMTRASAEHEYAHGLVVKSDDDRQYPVIPNQAVFGGDAVSMTYLIQRLQERVDEIRASRGDTLAQPAD